VWVTEFGFSTCAPAGGLCVTEAQQSQWLAESFKMMARLPFVTVVLSYNARNNDARTDVWNNNFGMMRFDLSAKPSLTAVSQTWSCLHTGTC
jgi:hypothetical protein